MITTILLFEPVNSRRRFYPFSIMHPVWEIRCGILRIDQKYNEHFPDSQVCFAGRQLQTNSFLERYEFKNQPRGGVLIADSSVLPDRNYVTKIRDKCHHSDDKLAFLSDGKLIAAFLPESPDNAKIIEEIGTNPEKFEKITSEFEKIEIGNTTKLGYLFDAIYQNGKQISSDLIFLKNRLKVPATARFPDISFIETGNVYIGENVRIMPQTVIDASDGPVIFDDNVKIMPQSTIVGPCYVGPNSLIKVGAKIYEDCSFGRFCKIGGEVENTIVHSYSNKQHDGFLGHAYLGQWINLGAGTNNSDLKNTYGNIKVLLEDEEVDSGSMFLGLLCGDHTKSAINTAFTTGTVAGICGILVSEGFHPRFIPSFSWGGKKNSMTYKVDKAIEVARKVTERRGKSLTGSEIKLLETEYDFIEK